MNKQKVYRVETRFRVYVTSSTLVSTDVGPLEALLSTIEATKENLDKMLEPEFDTYSFGLVQSSISEEANDGFEEVQNGSDDEGPIDCCAACGEPFRYQKD